MSGSRPEWRRLAVGLAVVAALSADRAFAITIELKDVAADRIERQRAAAEGRLPLAKTPDVSRLSVRLAEAGLKSGAAILLRVFKETSELEIWMEKDDRFVLFATYPMCHWSGTLGPKLREGDKQTPEGFYTLTSRQLRHIGRWPRSINLGYPNAFDRAQGRNGSHILMHGGCSSVGCFAMTTPVMAEIHGLAKAAISGGQRHVPVHVFPFRMTETAMAAHGQSPWHGFWTALRAGYVSFERTRRLPRISVCDGGYHVEDALPKASPEAETAGRGSSKSRKDAMHGAIRTTCPAPIVAAAEGKGTEGTAAADTLAPSDTADRR